MLPFLFGRIIKIKTFERSQRDEYHEALIAGDLTKEDIIQATSSNHSYGISILDTTELVYDNDTIYFAQPSLSQFVPGGSGAGTFNAPESIGQKDPPINAPAFKVGSNNPASTVRRGEKTADAILRYAPPAHWRCSSPP